MLWTNDPHTGDVDLTALRRRYPRKRLRLRAWLARWAPRFDRTDLVRISWHR